MRSSPLGAAVPWSAADQSVTSPMARRATASDGSMQETPGFLSSSHSLSFSGPNTSDAGTDYIGDHGITLAENIRVRGASLTE